MYIIEKSVELSYCSFTRWSWHNSVSITFSLTMNDFNIEQRLLWDKPVSYLCQTYIFKYLEMTLTCWINLVSALLRFPRWSTPLHGDGIHAWRRRGHTHHKLRHPRKMGSLLHSRGGAGTGCHPLYGFHSPWC